MTTGMIYYVDSDTGERRLLGQEDFSPLTSTRDIEDTLTERYWDSRLDGAGCKQDFEIFDDPNDM